jgi:voltage-gated potassium channel Kch
MADIEPRPKRQGPTLIDRRVRKIANARSVTLGLATTFLGLAFVGAIVMRIVDSHDFPTIGLALWWALQTVTTVGYGDIVPTSHIGRIIGGIELVLSVSFIAFLTAGVTSTVIQRGQLTAQESEGVKREQDVQTIVDALTETRDAIDHLDKRLDGIESRLAG